MDFHLEGKHQMASSDYMTIRDAVLKQLVVTARYDGYDREFCPHAIGSKNGEEHVLGYQFAGGSRRPVGSNPTVPARRLSHIYR
jgi:hypothetical protein